MSVTSQSAIESYLASLGYTPAEQEAIAKGAQGGGGGGSSGNAALVKTLGTTAASAAAKYAIQQALASQTAPAAAAAAPAATTTATAAAPSLAATTATTAAAPAAAAETGAAAASTQTAATGGSTVSGTLSAAAPYLAALIAAYMGYQSVKARNKLKGGYGTNLTDDELRSTSVPGFTTKYAPPGANQPGIARHLNPLTGGPAAMVDKLIWGSTKSSGQIYRDRVRKYMTKQGILDPEYNLDLGNGQKFNFGADGGARLKNFEGGGERRYNEIDTTNKNINTAELTSLLMPVGWSAAMASGDFKEGTRDAITSYMVNAAMQGAKTNEDAFKNARTLAAKFGFNTANSTQYVDELKKQGMIDSDADYNIFKTKAAYLAAPEDPKADQNASYQANLKAYLSQAGFGPPATTAAPASIIPRTGRGPGGNKK